MKNSNAILAVTVVPLLAWLGANLALTQVKLPGYSRRINNSPEYRKAMSSMLKLSVEGHVALQRKNYFLAEKKLRQSIAMDAMGGDYETWADLGRTLDEQGRSEEAYAAYREAYDNPKRGGSSNFPHDVETLTHYGIMCEDHSQHEAAVHAYNKAVGELNPRQTHVALDIPANPQQTPAPHLRALLNVMRGLTISEEKNVAGGQDRSDEALAAFQEAAQQAPDDARVQYYLGYGYQKAGQPSQAQLAYGKAAQLDHAGTIKAAVENLRPMPVRQ